VARITSRWLLRGGIAQLGLTASEGLVLLAIVDHADAGGIAWPSQYTLAAELGLARSTVQNSLTRLLERGVLVEHEPGRQGLSTRYRVAAQLARSQGQLRAVN
jgi:DNA-binding MarR family transcriptional regulator